jgi:DDE family transposase
MIDQARIRERFTVVSPQRDERARRLLAATAARGAGYGGIAAVSQATGVAPSTIARGLQDLATATPLAPRQVRRSDGGRKPLAEDDPTLRTDLLKLVEPDARGDPMSPLRWTCKSLRRLADELARLGHQVSRTVVGERLKAEKFSLQGNRKTREGGKHPDRDAQFDHINTSVKTALAEQQPVISVDTKKKALVGDFKNAGRTGQPQGEPEEVRVYDFLSDALGRAIPYGIYDLAANTGWVSVQDIGRRRHPNAQRLVITADGGGSNGVRVRLWKRELQCLANDLGIAIEAHHLPPGTSKWNKIEHRLFSFISMNWRATPLVSYRVIVDLISATTTKTGLSVRCELDPTDYPKGIVVSDAEIDALNLVRDSFHGEWNYTIRPQNPLDRAVIP